MKIKLSDHFTYKRLFRFTLSPVIMMIFTSIYCVVDGLFVANIVGSNALASINIIMPLVIVVGAVGFMLGTGGSAEVAKALGEGKAEAAKRYFTTLVLTIIVIGIILSSVLIITLRHMCYLLGASDLLIEGCVIYGRIQLIGITFFMLQTSFQTLFVTAERPKIGLILTIAAGVTNMFLDFLFISVFRMGIAGAAWATVIGFVIGGVIPLAYFFLPNHSLLRFTKTKLYAKMLLRSCINGSSEMISNLSTSIVVVLFNLQMMKLVGEDGVAAITIIMYVNMVFIAILIGFSIGTAPIIGYNYGAENHPELKNMFRKSVTVVTVVSVVMVIFAELIAEPLIAIFFGEETALAQMTVVGFRYYATSFLFCGINIFASSLFTSLCNGKVSAIISFLRALVFPVLMILILSAIWGLNGIWVSVTAAELCAAFISIFFIIRQKKKYQYA